MDFGLEELVAPVRRRKKPPVETGGSVLNVETLILLVALSGFLIRLLSLLIRFLWGSALLLAGLLVVVFILLRVIHFKYLIGPSSTLRA